MADNEQTEDGAPEAEARARAPKGKRKLIILAAALVLVIGAGAATWLFVFRHQDGEIHAEAPPPKPPEYVEVPDILVNLAKAPGERTQYLKVKVVLEVKDKPEIEKIKPAMPRLMDIFQTYLRELRPSDLNGSVGLFRLKEELTRRVNAALSPDQVSAVLFKEVVIQ